MSTPFAAALAVGDMATLARDCLAQLPRTEKDATLGILYVSEPAAPALGSASAPAERRFTTARLPR